MNFGFKIDGKGINARNTHTVKSAGHFITVLTELTAGVKNGQNHLKGGSSLFLVHPGRNTTAIILNCNGIILVDNNIYDITISGKRFVNRVIDYFIYQMMQTS